MKKWMKYLAFYIAGLLTLFVVPAFFSLVSSVYDRLDEMITGIDINIVALILTVLIILGMLVIIFLMTKQLQKMARNRPSTTTETADVDEDTDSSTPIGKKVEKVLGDRKYIHDTAS